MMIVTMVGEFPGGDFNTPVLAKQLSRTEAQINNIKTHLARLQVDVKNVEGITKVVNNYHFQVRRLADSLHNSGRNKNADTGWLVNPIVSELNALLLHLREEYQPYFDTTQMLSDVHRESVGSRLNEKLDTIKESRLQNADPELVQIISNCIQPWKSFSYNNLDYAEQLLDGLEQLSESATTADLIARLVEYNLNCPLFVSWLVRRISGGVVGGAPLGEKKEYFYNQHKIIRAVYSNAGVALIAANKPVREEICNWILEQIEIAEREEKKAEAARVQCHSELAADHIEDGYHAEPVGDHPGDGRHADLVRRHAVPHPVLTGRDSASPGEEKLIYNMNLETLALYYRALHDSGMIKAGNKRELFRVMARNCRTNNTEEVSAESARNKSYEPGRGSVNMLIEHCHSMIRQLKDYLD